MSIWHIPKHIPIVDLFLFAAKHGCKVVYDGAVYRLEPQYVVVPTTEKIGEKK